MSASLLYHTQGVRGFHYVRTEFLGGNVIFTVQQKSSTHICRSCSGRNVTAVFLKERDINALPVGKKDRLSAYAYIG